MATAITLAPLLRQSVGFDRFNDLLEAAQHNETATCYPPHNIERYGEEHYRIVIAAAGLTADDLAVQVDNSVLTVCGGQRDSDAGVHYIHQGIAHGPFRLVFHLAEHIEVQGATFNNGLLIVFLLRIAPEQAKARRITISCPGNGPDHRHINRH